MGKYYLLSGVMTLPKIANYMYGDLELHDGYFKSDNEFIDSINEELIEQCKIRRFFLKGTVLPLAKGTVVEKHFEKLLKKNKKLLHYLKQNFLSTDDYDEIRKLGREMFEIINEICKLVR